MNRQFRRFLTNLTKLAKSSNMIENQTNKVPENETKSKFLKKRKWYQRRSDRGETLGFKVPKNESDSQPFVRVKKRKYAILLGYSGMNYYGMQRNPKMKTIEEELLMSLFKCNYIDQEGFDHEQTISFQRAARTDKGVSAVRQIVSLKLPLEIEIGKINAHLPQEIRVLGSRIATKGFNSKNWCDSRTYSYTLPTVAFSNEPIDESIDRDRLLQTFRLSDASFKQLNDTLELFVGTKNFHNFTSKKKFYDPSANRHIKMFKSEEPFIENNVQFATIVVRGQSFMLHQIRKMIGIVIAIFRGFATVDLLEKCWTDCHLDIPMAPGLGLLLEYVHYEGYNKKYGNDKIHDKLEWIEENAAILEFKKQHILPTIIQTEIEKHSMLIWLETLVKHDFERENQNDDDQDGEECGENAVDGSRDNPESNCCIEDVEKVSV